jgi:hypothetical protein
MKDSVGRVIQYPDWCIDHQFFDDRRAGQRAAPLAVT